MRRLRIPLAIVGTVAFAVLMHQVRDHHRHGEQLRQLKQWSIDVASANSRLDAAVLRLRSDRGSDVAHVSALQRALLRLGQTGTHDADIRALRGVLDARIAHKVDLVQTFKTQASLLRNSVAVFDDQARRLKALRAVRERPALVRALEALTVAGLRFLHSADADDAARLRDAAQRLRRTASGLAGPDAALAEALHRELARLLERRSRVSELVDRIQNLGVTDAVFHLQNRVESAQRANAGEASLYRMAATVLVAIAVSWALGRMVTARRRRRHEKLTRLRLEREVAERTARLTEAEDRLRLILDSVWEGIYGVDTRGRATFVNPAAVAMLGYEPDELIGRDVIRRIFGPDEVDESGDSGRSLIRAAARGGATSGTRAINLRRKDGSRFPATLAANPMWRDGTPVGAVVSFADVTREREAQQQMKRLNRELMDAHRAAGMAEIATGVLHDVGNAMNSVNIAASQASLALRQSSVSRLRRLCALLEGGPRPAGKAATDGVPGEGITTYLCRITERLERERDEVLGELDSLTTVLEHIMEVVARQQAYAVDVSAAHERISVATIVEDALTMQLADDTGVEIVRDYDDVPEVTCDKHKLMQVLVNVLENARESVLAGDASRPRIELRVERDGGDLLVRVADNGVGISPEDRDRIFECGFSTKSGGLGVGLHASALAMQEIGGSLEAASGGPRHGAVFTLRIPA